MATYRPKSNIITIPAGAEGIIYQDVSTDSWGLLLLFGSAIYGSTVISSGAVALWLAATSASAIGDPALVTFTDAYGRFGITVQPNQSYVIRVYK